LDNLSIVTVRSQKPIPFRPPQRRRIHEEVGEQLRDAILDGRFTAGEKLPPERELAEEFQVNRTSVREAIKGLEGLGLVSVRQGDGATVQPLMDASFDVLAPMVYRNGRVDPRALSDVMEVIMPLLFEMARLALERHQPEELGELRRLRDVMANEGLERETRFAAGRDVVVLLSDMTRNRVWQMLARRARTLLASEPLREARRRLRRDPALLVGIIDSCLEAMDAGRPDVATIELRRLIQLVGDSTLMQQDGRSRTSLAS
jgi:DNA-binding FadR family transcriptional regulator